MRSFFTPINTALALCSGLFLAACENQTQVQNDYVAHRDQCQSYAESNIGRFANPGESVDVRSRNAKLVTLFSDCMFEQGWTVATPEREGQQQADARDDLPQLNDVPAGAVAAKAPAAASIAQQPATSGIIPLDPNRRAPAEQY